MLALYVDIRLLYSFPLVELFSLHESIDSNLFSTRCVQAKEKT